MTDPAHETSTDNARKASPSPASDDHAPLHGARLGIATLFVAAATLMTVLDTTIANVAIPTLSGNLGVSIDEGTWVITIFAAANAIAIPLTGWMTQQVGQVKLFVGAIISFVIASWLCGIAPTLPFLLVARILQGIVAGPLIPLSQALLLSAWPKAKARTALSLWAMTATVGPIAGPLLGGWITDNYNWSWIFYVNIPVGIIAAAGVWIFFRERETQTRKSPIDVFGLMLLMIWVGSLQVMLDKGKDLDWFSSPVIVLLGLVALIAFAIFIIWELTEKHPIIDLTLFKERNFLWGTVAISVSFGLYFGNLVILPQWMQTYLGYTAFYAGLVTAPVGIFSVLFAPVVGRLIAHLDVRWIATLSFLGFSGAFFMRTAYPSEVDPFHLVLPTLLQGIPVAFWLMPLTSIILSGLPASRIAAAAGLSNFARIFCGAIGTSISNTVWSDRIILHHVRLTEQASIYNPAFSEQIAAIRKLLHLDLAGAYAAFDAIVEKQAAVMGLSDFSYASSIIFVLLVPLIWFTRPQGRNPENDAASAGH